MDVYKGMQSELNLLDVEFDEQFIQQQTSVDSKIIEIKVLKLKKCFTMTEQGMTKGKLLGVTDCHALHDSGYVYPACKKEIPQK